MKLEKNFNKAKSKISSNKEQALNRIGILVTAEAQSRTPVDTGRLRRSLAHDVHEDSVDIGTNVEYASYVEHGTSKQKAQPFLNDAITQSSDKIKDIIKEVMSDM